MDETNGGGGQPVFLVLILIYSLYLFFLTHFCSSSLSLSPFPSFNHSYSFALTVSGSFSALAQPLLCSSLYQPPQRRPSAVWSPCAATNKGKVAVPAWPASWTKWLDIAKPAPAIATHPAAATGGQGIKEPWLWISMNLQGLLVSWIKRAAMTMTQLWFLLLRIVVIWTNMIKKLHFI